MRPKYSIVVPVFNRPQELSELLGSILKLKLEQPIEVVIIEDGSTEDSERVCQNFQREAHRITDTLSRKRETLLSTPAHIDPQTVKRDTALTALGVTSTHFSPAVDTSDESKSFEGSSRISSHETQRESPGLISLVYHKKENTGPGHSRNCGVHKSSGEYVIFVDSDCILPPDYISEIDQYLSEDPLDFFGGPDRADTSFTDFQKAIDFAMTSVLTTGGVRGANTKNFQPRSFNMGVKRKAFLHVGGFGNIHPGEDPDLVFRLWREGYRSNLMPEAFVYHKRRISWSAFQKQVGNFGKVRPILMKWHASSRSATFFLPSIATLVAITAPLLFLFTGNYLLLVVGFFYIALLFLTAVLSLGSVRLALMAVRASLTQILTYGSHFAISWFKLNALGQQPKTAYPDRFFPDRPPCE